MPLSPDFSSETSSKYSRHDYDMNALEGISRPIENSGKQQVAGNQSQLQTSSLTKTTYEQALRPAGINDKFNVVLKQVTDFIQLRKRHTA